MSRRHKILIALAAFSLAVTSGLMVYADIAAARHSRGDNSYSLLAQPSRQTSSRREFDIAKLQYILEAYIERLQLDFGIYFEYLPTGKSIGVHQDKVVIAASLAKLPVVMELYRQKDLGRIDIDQQLPIPRTAIDNRSGDLWKKGAGYKLTLEKAAELTLAESDNTALKMLIYYLELARGSTDITSYLTLAHGVAYKGKDSVTSPWSYTQLIKCLYSSCDNTKDSSQKILSMMTRSKISLLRSGVPAGVTVADKFGIYYPGAAKTGLNDCGIVYSSAGNYVLCVMGTGTDSQVQTIHTAISSLVYTSVTQNTPQ